MGRRAKTAGALVLGLALGGAAAAQDGPDHGPLFEAVWETVDRNFYDPGFNGADWAAIGERYRARLDGARDDAAFAALANAMLAELAVSHLRLSPPAADQGFRGVGARFETIGGASVAVEVSPFSDAWRQGLRPGDQLMSDASALRGPPDEAARLTVRTCAGERRELTVARMAAGWPPEQPGWRWSRISPRPGLQVGHLRVDRFDDGAAELADQAMAALGGTGALIIDLRANSGGNTSALRLASHFMPEGAAPAFALFARGHLDALGRAPDADDIADGPRVAGAYTDAAVFEAVSAHDGAAVFLTDPLDGRRYEGAVIVLIGPDTGSAAEGFAWLLRTRSAARFVGRETAGALLSGERFALPGGWTLTVPVHGIWGPDGQDLADAPVAPDIATAWSREDLCSGADPDLEAAFALVSELSGAD
ncbi:hypothetical protein FKB34_01595 [Glycocaulis profundi]|nr:hypothetical protein FKB34_01595 [Glycocaulis profundi]